MEGFIPLFIIAGVFAVLTPWGMRRDEINRRKRLIAKNPEHALQLQEAFERQDSQQHLAVQQRRQTAMQAAWEPAPQPKSGGFGKVIIFALCAIYILSPLDFIPDVIPVAGWGDDLVAALVGLRQLIK